MKNTNRWIGCAVGVLIPLSLMIYYTDGTIRRLGTEPYGLSGTWFYTLIFPWPIYVLFGWAGYRIASKLEKPPKPPSAK